MQSYVAGNDKYDNKFRCDIIVISGQPITLTIKDTSGDYRLLNEIFNQLGYTYLKLMPENTGAEKEKTQTAED